ncbi:Fur family transcriptional regulator [Sphingomonas flavalba]|uniref:Fur family transcriptional regulator n=1 Tax=Sphingomonas flavalba TaxID=2559804 RepID=UPI00109D996E|nr:transcriptional repressor [Sphingomonas flavalba]
MRSDTGASAGGRPPARRPYRRPSPLDRLVLQTLREAGRPLSAYAITRRSVASGAPLSPTQAYRVLDRLVARGEVQRIALLAAYLPARADRPGVLVCRRCRAVTAVTVAALAPAIEQIRQATGFVVARAHVELPGLRARCRHGRGAARASACSP